MMNTKIAILQGTKLMLVAVAIAVGLMLVSFGCRQKESAPKEKVTLGVASIIMATPIFIAREKGYFAEEGLEVVCKPYAFGKKAMEGMFAGENDIATVAETPIIFQSFVRNDFSIFATFFQSYNDAKIVAGKDKAISLPADLKGKRIGTIEGTSAHYFLYMYLLEHGIDSATTTISFYPAAELANVLKNDMVDAIVAFEPYAYNAKLAMPGETVTLPQSTLFRETFNLVAMKGWAEQHRQTLEKMIRATDRAVTFVQHAKQESIDILVKNTPFSKELLEAVWDDYSYQVSLDNSMLTTMEDEARWAIETKLVDRRTVPNYLEYYYLDAMKAVKPEAISIVK